jgi:hypothetical protein
LQRLLRAHGWPNSSQLGVGPAESAWLIAQHADHDVRFQLTSLRRVIKVVDAGVLAATHAALLIDRIAVNVRVRQLFGTQSRLDRHGRLRLWPIERVADVNLRRRQVGLRPLVRAKLRSAGSPRDFRW